MKSYLSMARDQVMGVVPVLTVGPGTYILRSFGYNSISGRESQVFGPGREEEDSES